MRKKLLITLLAGTICLLGVSSVLAQQAWDTLQKYEEATGNKIEKFNESPMLRAKVAAGEILPVEQRLPEEPQVVEPLEKIGLYGGIMRLTGVAKEGSELEASTRNMARMTYDRKIEPSVAKGWDLSDDCKTLTLYLRKGMKWSDGAPFTADDVLFWYEDIVLNKELTPSMPRKWSPGGEPMVVTKVDDYTIQFEFSVPYPTAIVTLTTIAPDPKHYLVKYHINYNPDANELAKEEGYNNWWESFGYHTDILAGQPFDVNLPVVTPWVSKERDAAQNTYWERNPYYWRVDTAGNQLPYIDKVMYMNVQTPEVVAMKSMSGEIDSNVVGLNFADYPVYKKNEEAGGYKVYLFPHMSSATSLSYTFNYTHEDPVLEEIINDIRFRQASSLAINREEISQTVFFGKTPAWTAPVTADWTGFEDWMGTYYAEYDPERANELLDEMGLEWDEDHEYRLRPDGKTLSIVGEYALQWLGGFPGQVAELIQEYWKEIGIKLTPKQVGEDLIGERMAANKHDLIFWNADGAEELPTARADYPIRLMPPWHWVEWDLWMGGTEWRRWYDTEGKEGEVPPENIQRMFTLVEEWLATPYTEQEKYRRLANELITLNVKGLYLIGTVKAAPFPVIRKNGLRNARRETGLFTTGFGAYMADQWFLEK